METVETFPLHDGEETLVTPRFDREEARSAQPVVPLTAVSRAEAVEVLADDPRGDIAAPRRSFKQGSWWVVIAFASALVGSVLGGAGLYFFQKQNDSKVAASPASANVIEPAPSSASTPTPETTAAISTLETEAPEPERSAPTSSNDPPRKIEAARTTSREDDSIKHGKQGSSEVLVRDERPRRTADRNVYDPETESESQPDDDRQARQVGEIVYPRTRRSERRARRQQSVDRVRGIFEGQP